ncbi:HlyD family efflux transporter periplasmic adaptor subunit [Mycetocola tolaasinivorans]|uniref:HlyD family efflux transporter periplasmic adaptor subunit n=1 Tax=Mycetocola tolaasinivorans TaxID=76635 RepID=A0A3L7ABJ1_9MICO|nr:HlyD family efflux transporter periplasmic adaptor subunit [Mycetocola tolaasinivorans]RLP77779.1 HlyD family efflux transporter periplasmic adaptor subunit [Mycetocola tolaasinivorans]
MGVWRRWIFPSLRIAVFAAIAVALVKIAFFPTAEPEREVMPPTGNVDEQVVAVVTGNIVNEIELDATVAADPAIPARANLVGEVAELHVTEGASVAAGAVIATLRNEIEQEPIVRTDSEGNVTTVIPKPKYRTAQVTTSVAGTVSSLPLVVGQSVAIGDAVAQVAPTTFSVTATIDPAQRFRLVEEPSEARVSVVGGPADFTCTALRITTPLEGQTEGEGAGSPGAAVRCAVPGDVRVFAGLGGKLMLPGGSVENALILPVTAVKGSSQSGNVWVVAEGGAPEIRDVKLGLNDGRQVQIVEGVAEGDSVLEFIPATDPTNPETGKDIGNGCVELPDGSVECGAVGYVEG